MIFIIGAGLMQIPAIRIASQMGLKTIVTDYNPEAPGLALADVPIVMSTKDIEGTVRTARQYHHKIRGVLTVGTDASLTVSAVAGALGLTGIHYEAAEKATHKLKMRNALRNAGVAVPEFAGVWSIDEARGAAERIRYPVVFKPVDNMGSRGVIRVDNITQVEQAYRHAKSCSTSGEVIVEAFMDGPELSIDSLVWNSEIICSGVADRIIARPPYFIELGHNLPSAQPPEIQEAAVELMRGAVKALGITCGAAKGDVKITKDGPMIGECAARLSGGWMSSHTFPLSTGYSMIRGAIEIAIGRKPVIPEFLNRVAMERAVLAVPGRITRIDGVNQALRIKGVKDIIMKARIDDIVTVPISNMEKQGHVIAVSETSEECEAIVKKALETIRIETHIDQPLKMADIHGRARNLFGKYCRACRVCDGVFCAGMVPGMGGIGTGYSFMANLEALGKYRMVERLIHSVSSPRMATTLLGLELSIPVIAAPITGAVTNMGGAITEEDFAEAMVMGSLRGGTVSCVGDGATPDKYRIGLDAASRAAGKAIPIFKPRAKSEVMTRVRAAIASGCPAIGMDIDGAAFVTMRSRGQSVGPKDADELRSIIAECEVPFLVKGIMNARDAETAVKAGAAAVIVGNHGGRVMDQMPGGAEVLPEIVAAIRGSAVIILDGGIRTGEDILKSLALGADLCMIGRPVAIAAVGGGSEGVALYWKELKEQIERAMILTGQESVERIDPGIIRKA
mgnify:CR=1 FL=1